jgi:hypothetical protein
MEAADNPILKWAVSVIASAPPMQNVIAFLIVFLLAMPLLRAGWKEFRKKEPAISPIAFAPPALIQETPWLITTLTRIQLEVEDLKREADKFAALPALIEGLTKEIGRLAGIVAVVDKMLRRRTTKK